MGLGAGFGMGKAFAESQAEFLRPIGGTSEQVHQVLLCLSVRANGRVCRCM
jgi:hypothetical protein